MTSAPKPADEPYGLYLPPGPEVDPDDDIAPTATSEDPDGLQRARKQQYGDVGVVLPISTDQDDIKAALGLPYTLEAPSSAGRDLLRAEIRSEQARAAIRDEITQEVEAERAEQAKTAKKPEKAEKAEKPETPATRTSASSPSSQSGTATKTSTSTSGGSS